MINSLIFFYLTCFFLVLMDLLRRMVSSSSLSPYLCPETSLSVSSGKGNSPVCGYCSKCDDHRRHWEHGNVCWPRCRPYQGNFTSRWSCPKTGWRGTASDPTKIWCHIKCWFCKLGGLQRKRKSDFVPYWERETVKEETIGAIHHSSNGCLSVHVYVCVVYNFYFISCLNYVSNY